MKLLIIFLTVYSFYFSSLGEQGKLETTVWVKEDKLYIESQSGVKTLQIIEYLKDGEAVSGKLKRYKAYHYGREYYVEMNDTYCFLKSQNLEEVFSNFEVKFVPEE